MKYFLQIVLMDEPTECPLKVEKALKTDRRNLYELLEYVSAQIGSGLKKRSNVYIRYNIGNFITIKDGANLIACGEIIQIDANTIELGAIATHPHYQGQWLSDRIIEYSEQHALAQNKSIIVVTNNPVLIRRLENRKYSEVSVLYHKRAQESPGKKIYTKIQ